ncbi:MAG: T9SS type A sorting domain-containing protein [Bacteroidaceae bacterium]|nr:T9SS type A sorting domain-containing protein [Bacteroidaceae bacterium]
MKKHLLTLVMLLMGSVAWAQGQSGSGWTNPASEYPAHTVVYLAIQSDNYDVLHTDEGAPAYPEVAAFVGGELRGWADTESLLISPEDKTSIFNLRVGGTIGTDENKEITFQVYDSKTGIVYPLSCDNTITWTGDETGNYPSEYYTMTFEPATELKLYNGEVEITELSLHVNEEVSLGDCTAKLVNSAGAEVEAIFQGKWEINEVYPYVSLVESDGAFTIKGMQETPDGDKDEENDFVEEVISYVVGSLVAPISVQVLPEYFPVTSIAIEDVNYYWPGYGRLVITNDMVIYNGGESTPTNPGVKIVSSSNEDVVAIVDNTLSYKCFGSSKITVAAVDNEAVTTTFTINILSALEGMRMDGYTDDMPFTYERNSDDEEYIKLPMPLFDWIMGDDGDYVIAERDERFTISSSDESILRIEEDGQQAVSLKKGTVTVTFTSVYDPTKSVKLTVITTQPPTGVAITQIGAVEIGTDSPVEPVVDVAVGQGVTSTVKINPADADFENIVIMITDADGYSPIDSEIVTTGDPISKGDGTYEFTFTFLSVPDGDVYLQAIVDENWSWSDRVQLNVIQSVTGISPIPETIDIWVVEEDFGMYTGEIEVTVLPETANNKALSVKTSDEGIVTIDKGPSENIYIYTVQGKGTATITFTSDDNPSVSGTCVITVKKKVTSIEVEGLGEALHNDGEPQTVTVTILPEDADYDMEKLSASVTCSDMYPEDWEFVAIEELSVEDNTAMYSVVGRSLCSYVGITFEYDAIEQGEGDIVEYQTEISVREKVCFTPGWNWTSIISGWIFVNDMEGTLDEMRSQSALIIDDPVWGLFGNLYEMDNSQAYKVKTKVDADNYEFVVGESMLNEEGRVEDITLEHGWNWKSYPYEYAYYVSDIFEAEQFNEGDKILSKNDGFVTLTEGIWEGNLDVLRPNQGYLIYSTVETGEQAVVNMPNRYELEQGTFENRSQAPQRERLVWNYDGSRFANTMAIIGQIDVQDAEDYSIGAFVGDECRGKGKFVNGKAYITAAGEPGDMVTLRLYNQWTGEYVEVLGEVAFTDIAGSVKEPIRFSAVETGVDHLSAATLTIQANVAYASGDIQVYDAQGKLVAEGYQRVDLNHLNQGVYMVKSGDQSRKIVK